MVRGKGGAGGGKGKAGGAGGGLLDLIPITDIS
jgi:hypothetical protein